MRVSQHEPHQDLKLKQLKGMLLFTPVLFLLWKVKKQTHKCPNVAKIVIFGHGYIFRSTLHTACRHLISTHKQVVEYLEYFQSLTSALPISFHVLRYCFLSFCSSSLLILTLFGSLSASIVLIDSHLLFFNCSPLSVCLRSYDGWEDRSVEPEQNKGQQHAWLISRST